MTFHREAEAAFTIPQPSASAQVTPHRDNPSNEAVVYAGYPSHSVIRVTESPSAVKLRRWRE